LIKKSHQTKCFVHFTLQHTEIHNKFEFFKKPIEKTINLFVIRNYEQKKYGLQLLHKYSFKKEKHNHLN